MKWLLPVTLLLALLALLSWRVIDTSGSYVSETKVAGINIGKLDQAQARRKIASHASGRAVVLLAGGKRVELSAAELGLKPRIEAALDRAQERQPSLLAKVFGFGSPPAVALTYDYRPAGVDRGIDQLRGLISRPARDARIVFASEGLRVKPARPGQRLRLAGLRERVHQAAMQGGGSVTARVAEVRPRVGNREELLTRDPVLLLVDKSERQLYLFRGLELKETYPVAIGMPGFDTPEGEFRIANKSIDPAWMPPDWAGELAGQLVPGGSPDNPLISRWLGIIDGVGIHGTRDVASLGSAASHGCIRMSPEQVIELYPQVPVGSRIKIQA